jgi:NTE family protein
MLHVPPVQAFELAPDEGVGVVLGGGGARLCPSWRIA